MTTWKLCSDNFLNVDEAWQMCGVQTQLPKDVEWCVNAGYFLGLSLILFMLASSLKNTLQKIHIYNVVVQTLSNAPPPGLKHHMLNILLFWIIDTTTWSPDSVSIYLYCFVWSWIFIWRITNCQFAFLMWFKPKITHTTLSFVEKKIYCQHVWFYTVYLFFYVSEERT